MCSCCCNSNKKLKVGIIGCGGIANGKHMPSLHKLDNVEMVAFCDIIKERAEEAARKYGVEDAFVCTDYRDLLKDNSIDVVHVCTPNKSHSFITVDALEAGKHVMCEKPMAKTYEEAKKMVERLRKSIERMRIEIDEMTIKVTASFGLVTVRSFKLEPNELIKLADIKLYEAKKRGGNKVVS